MLSFYRRESLIDQPKVTQLGSGRVRTSLAKSVAPDVAFSSFGARTSVRACTLIPTYLGESPLSLILLTYKVRLDAQELEVEAAILVMSSL